MQIDKSIRSSRENEQLKHSRSYLSSAKKRVEQIKKLAKDLVVLLQRFTTDHNQQLFFPFNDANFCI